MSDAYVLFLYLSARDTKNMARQPDGEAERAAGEEESRIKRDTCHLFISEHEISIRSPFRRRERNRSDPATIDFVGGGAEFRRNFSTAVQSIPSLYTPPNTPRPALPFTRHQL